MPRIFITGDIHGDPFRFSHKNWPEGKELTKDDYVIVLGDFGMIWMNEPDKDEIYKLQWLSDKSWTTLFLDGNHENHLRLNKFPEVEMFGDRVGKITDSIFHLKRGRVYNICGKKFFCMGGAKSVDKIYRREFISWWTEEEPNWLELELGLENLSKHNNCVDFILGHTSSISVIKRLGEICKFDFSPKSESLNAYFEKICSFVSFRKMFFGHFHADENIDGVFHCLFEDIIEIE